MLLEMFVNELSLTPCAHDELVGQDRIKQFVMTMRAATAIGVQRTLRLPEDFFTKTIAPNYGWYDWLRDGRVDVELRQYFRSLATRMPFLRDQPGEETAWAGLDCFWQNNAALGLKAAYVTDGLAISLSSRSEWNDYSIECEIQEIVDNGVSIRRENIHHASLATHMGLQSAWIQQRIQSAVRNGGELWNRAGGFFPSLAFCAAIQEQMYTLPAHALASITRGLFCLNNFCVAWQSGAFDPTRLACVVSPESQQTLNKYGDERTFLCPDGQKRVFSWHIKVGQWRIYFGPFSGPGNVTVGYVGKHLRTVSFN